MDCKKISSHNLKNVQATGNYFRIKIKKILRGTTDEITGGEFSGFNTRRFIVSGSADMRRNSL
jgi:hypothetical protein